MIRFRSAPTLAMLAALLPLATLTPGCRQKEDVRVYTVDRADERLNESVASGATRAGLPPNHPPIDGSRLPPGHPDISGIQGMGSMGPVGGQSSRVRMQWTLPPGWKADPQPKAPRYATLLAPAGSGTMDVGVFNLGGDLLSNVNRWRDQLHLPPIAEADLATATTSLKTDAGETATLVEIRSETAPIRATLGVIFERPGSSSSWFIKAEAGPESVAAIRGALLALVKSVRFAGPSTQPAMGAGLIVPAAPAGWKPSAEGADGSAFDYRIGDDAHRVRVAASLSPAGDPALLSFLNKCREMADQPPVSDLKDQPAAGRAEVAGADWPLYSFTGSAGSAHARTQIRVVRIAHGDRDWIIAVGGPPADIDARWPAVTAFLKTLRFEEGGHE
ncbi:MAG: hypothetical protein BIFFINMI_00114 [Phycisphaerae bacterium]|nr:hypothetical protein [Phycisphaerae bacterium]